MMRVSEISKNTLFELRDWRRWMDILWAMHAVWFTYWCLHQIKSLLKAGFLSSVCLCFNINMSRKLKLNVREVFIRVETFGIKMWYIKIKKTYVVSKRCKMSQFWIFFSAPISTCSLDFLVHGPEPAKIFIFRFDFIFFLFKI